MYNFARIEKIGQELDSIIKSPEILPFDKIKDLHKIEEQINKIYLKNSLAEVESIYEKINKIYLSDTITKEQEIELSLLESRIEKLFINKSKADISAEDEKKLESLYEQMDELFIVEMPTEDEIQKAEILLDEQEIRYASMFARQGYDYYSA